MANVSAIIVSSSPGVDDIIAMATRGHGLDETTRLALQVLHGCLATAALLANCLFLVVIYGAVPRLTPRLQLLTSISFSDMLAVWAVMTPYFSYSVCQEAINISLLLCACNASAWLLIALTTSHSVAIFRPLHYNKIVSSSRVWAVIALAWITGVLMASSGFFATAAAHEVDARPFCAHVHTHQQVALIVSTFLTAGAFFFSTFMCGRIVAHLRPIESIVDGVQTRTSRRSTHRVTSTVMMAVVHVVTWLPYLVIKCVQLSRGVDGGSIVVSVGLAVCHTFILGACLLNPILCALRMPSLQTGYHRLYRRSRDCLAKMWFRIKRKETDASEQPSTPLNPLMDSTY